MKRRGHNFTSQEGYFRAKSRGHWVTSGQSQEGTGLHQGKVKRALHYQEGYIRVKRRRHIFTSQEGYIRAKSRGHTRRVIINSNVLFPLDIALFFSPACCCFYVMIYSTLRFTLMRKEEEKNKKVKSLVCRHEPCELLLPLALGLGLHCPSPTDHRRGTTRQTHDLTSDIPSHQTEDFLS